MTLVGGRAEDWGARHPVAGVRQLDCSVGAAHGYPPADVVAERLKEDFERLMA